MFNPKNQSVIPEQPGNEEEESKTQLNVGPAAKPLANDDDNYDFDMSGDSDDFEKAADQKDVLEGGETEDRMRQSTVKAALARTINRSTKGTNEQEGKKVQVEWFNLDQFCKEMEPTTEMLDETISLARALKF